MAKLSLQEQMLKAGLVNQKKLKKASKASKKSRDLAKEVKASVEASKKQQIEKAKTLNKAQQDIAHKKAIKAQIHQLITMNQIQLKGDIKYNFTDTNIIKYLYVNEEIRTQLIAGVLAIAKIENTYFVIPNIVAKKIIERDQSYVLAQEQAAKDTIDEDDPYADYVVPDDLMW